MRVLAYSGSLKRSNGARFDFGAAFFQFEFLLSAAKLGDRSRRFVAGYETAMPTV